MKNEKIKKIAVTAILTALAFLLTFVFRFKVGFLTFDFKDAMISIVSLLLGPLYGVCSAFLVALIEAVTVSDTQLYGFIMNFVSSATFALSLGLVYKYKRSFSGAIIASVTAVFSVTAVMLLANMVVTPLYLIFMNKTLGEAFTMISDAYAADKLSGVFSLCYSQFETVVKMVPLTLLPFNFIKATVNTTVLLAIYKPFTMGLKKSGLIKSSGDTKYTFDVKSILLLVVSVVIFVVAILCLIMFMGGEFNLIKPAS